jgi:hypothetical protein
MYRPPPVGLSIATMTSAVKSFSVTVTGLPNETRMLHGPHDTGRMTGTSDAVATQVGTGVEQLITLQLEASAAAALFRRWAVAVATLRTLRH